MLNDFDPNRDQAKVRSVELDNGNKYNVTPQGQHGFCKISMERGQIPAELDGWYTTFDQAKFAITQYVEKQKTRKVVEKK